MNAHLRVARPVSDLERTVAMYSRGLDLRVVGRFEDHQGFDGAMLGHPGMDYHFEFTFCRMHPIRPTPTPEDLIVFYISDPAEWHEACERMAAAGFAPVASLNPYWQERGRTFEDADGYRVVLQQASWRNEPGR